jgi:hypothetical protein
MHMMSRLLFLLTSRIEDRRCDVVIGFTYFRSLPVFCFRTLSVVDIAILYIWDIAMYGICINAPYAM